MSNAMQTCYSTNNEDFTPDRELVFEQLAETGRFTVGTEYYEADSTPLAPHRVLLAVDVLEAADERGADLIGESWDDPFCVGLEAQQTLQRLLDGWVKQHVRLDAYWEVMGSSRRVRVTEQDVRSHKQAS